MTLLRSTTMLMATSPWTQVIGIVGGLGPQSHLLFERHLLDAVGDVTTEQEYPPWVLVSCPSIPDRTTAIVGQGESPIPGLNESLTTLKAAGAGFAVIVCNTAHHFLPSLSSILPILDIIEEGLREAVEGLETDEPIGVLATTGTLDGKVYQRAAERLRFTRKILTILDMDGGADLQRTLVMEPIYGRPGDPTFRGIKQGSAVYGDNNQSRACLHKAAALLISAGARAVIMGCTEIPLVLKQEDLPDVRLVDPLVSAARAAIEVAEGRRSVTHGFQEARS